MPNVAEVALVASVVESAIAKIAPTLSERLIADLPQIFGGAGMRVAELLGHVPATAKPIVELGEAYQASLSRFGLERTASPRSLYEAASRGGLEQKLLPGHSGFWNPLSPKEINLGNGFKLSTRGSLNGKSFDSMATFSNPSINAQIEFNNFCSNSPGVTNSWLVRAQDFSHEVKRLGW